MIKDYGWNDALQREFVADIPVGQSPGRVIVQQRDLYGLATNAGEVSGQISGKLAREAPAGGYPAVGDWIAFSLDATGKATIHHVLNRRTAFVRKASGRAGGLQVVAANVDIAFLVASLNADLNPRRLERYLAAAWQSGAAPVILLTKADLCDDVGIHVSAIEATSSGAPIVIVSSLTGTGLDEVRALMEPGRTAVMVGSSGAGKSTLANALLGVNRMATQPIREADAKGRHTTSHRELILLPGGGLLLDTPGMREFGLWDSDEGLSTTFGDIEALAKACRFNDCSHTNEPDCAVRAALANAELDEDRWRGFQKLQREAAFLESKEDPALRAAKRRKWVEITKANRAKYRDRNRS